MFEIFTYTFVQMALLAALIIAGIHAYLGYHVVSRGVIFVDLSLAQVAALGSVAALVLGIENPVARYFVSLGFTFGGALLVSLARTRDERVPQEAFIGIIYAASTALSILLLSGHPEGREFLEHMIAGSLLTATPAQVARFAVTFGALGAFFYAMRSRFELISENRQEAQRRGWNLVLWDFLFYAAFAVVVTTAVTAAGVLLVFSFLVIPPVTAMLLVESRRARLLLGWAVGFGGALVGILLSVSADLPAGPSVISTLAAILAVASIATAARGRA